MSFCYESGFHAIAYSRFYQYENKTITLEGNNNDNNSTSEADRVVINTEDQMEMSLIKDALAAALIQE